MLYLLLFLSVIFALYVIHSNNVVYSLMSLVLVFFLSGLVLIALRMEFLGYMLIIVYVGAIAILFLFVIITLDLTREQRSDSKILNAGGYASIIVGLSYTAVMLLIVSKVFGPTSRLLDRFSFVIDPLSTALMNNSMWPLALSLYTHNFMYLLLGGLLLLVAMVGAVALTLEPKRPNQDSQVQQYRSISSSVSLSKERKPRKFIKSRAFIRNKRLKKTPKFNKTPKH